MAEFQWKVWKHKLFYTKCLWISYFFQIFTFSGSSVICLSLSEIPIWTHQREFGLSLRAKGGVVTPWVHISCAGLKIKYTPYILSTFFIHLATVVTPTYYKGLILTRPSSKNRIKSQLFIILNALISCLWLNNPKSDISDSFSRDND